MTKTKRPAKFAGARNGKFNAAGERVNGVWMASAAQAERYRQLLFMAEVGIIGDLRTEVSFPLVVENQLICKYRCDFIYNVLDERGEPLSEVIEDVKGMVTPEFVLKHKLFDALIPTKLSVIHVKGKAIHPDATINGGKSGSAGWMHRHWMNRIPGRDSPANS